MSYEVWGDGDEDDGSAERLHGFGWGDPFPKPRDLRQGDLFAPMCSDCIRRAA